MLRVLGESPSLSRDGGGGAEDNPSESDSVVVVMVVVVMVVEMPDRKAGIHRSRLA